MVHWSSIYISLILLQLKKEQNCDIEILKVVKIIQRSMLDLWSVHSKLFCHNFFQNDQQIYCFINGKKPQHFTEIHFTTSFPGVIIIWLDTLFGWI